MAKAIGKELGRPFNRKRVQRLMKLMGLVAIYPKPNTRKANPEEKKYPYLLRNLVLTGPNQVWSTDITYFRLEHGFAYLIAVIDWYSRKVISWRLSNTMEASACAGVLVDALKHGTPDIFNTDQGSQFTSELFIKVLDDVKIKTSMGGR